MLRNAVIPSCVLVAVFAVGLATASIATPAHAQDDSNQIWEPAGPIATSAGMTAVATDPDNAKVVWLGSATSVWVSEDEGETFHLVLQLSRAAGLVRDTGSAPTETDEQDRDQENTDNTDSSDDSGNDTEIDDGGDTPDSRADNDDENDNENGNSDDEDAPRVEARFGVARLRVFGDVVYACTSRGLFTIARDARRMGTGHELRFGKKVAVNDVAVTADKRVWIATDAGLIELGGDGIGRPAHGMEEDLQVRAVIVSEGRLVAATARGMRIASPTNDNFDRFSVGGRDDDGGLEDVLAEANGRVLVTGQNQVSRVSVKAGDVPTVDETWSVPSASRLALGRGGARWAVGGKGAWKLTPDQGFQRESDGLFDRRLRDVAPGFGPVAALWSVGRSGAWRLVAESGHAFTAGAQRLAVAALEGFPDDDKVVKWAIKARGIDLGRVDDWALEERLSWLLPHVALEARWTRQRNEDRLLIPVLDRRILDAVEVKPIDDELIIVAYWDVMPALVAAIDGSQPYLEQSRVRARRQLERVREVIMPIYQTWARKRIELATSDSLTMKDALKAMLAIQRLEADLHAYTGGHFPVMDASSTKKPQ